MVRVTSLVAGAVIASSAATGPVSMEASAPITWSDGVLAGLPHGDGEEPVLWLAVGPGPAAPDGDAPDQRGPAPAQQSRRRKRRGVPGRTLRNRGGRCTARGAVVVRERVRRGLGAACCCATVVVLALSSVPLAATGRRVGSGVVRREQRATILDVAALAGVHAATVSRTINVPEKVAPETRRRVEAAVRELGFVPNRAGPRPHHRTDGERRGDRPRHHQPSLRVPGAIGGAVGPAERSAGAAGRHRRASGRRGAGGGVAVPGGRRVHHRLAPSPPSCAACSRDPRRQSSSTARYAEHASILLADGTGRG